MRPTALFIPVLLALAPLAAQARDFDDWPTKYTFSDGTELAGTLNFAYDYNDFSSDDRLEDDDGMRRREFGATLRKKGVYDAMVNFDFEAETWLDVYFRFETKALFGNDYGRVRFGYMKTPVGLEGVTASRATNFLEVGLPTQAFYQGRRTGVEWVLERPQYLLQVGAYGGQDLQGDNPGTTQAVRAVWTPIKASGDVLHLGLAGSVENPRGYHDGRGISYSARTRIRTRPEAGLTDVRLVDSGTLVEVDQIQRLGFEQIWIHGPFLVQSEALQMDVSRDNGRPDYTGNGQYITGSWVLTGESRAYTGSNVGNVKPERSFGAVELLARYSRVDLDDADIDGGRQHAWTFGANWYLTSHFKFQANYVKADVSRAGVHSKPEVVELRAQVMF